MTPACTSPRRPVALLGAYRQQAREFRRAVERDDGRAKADASARMTDIESEIRERGYRITPEPPLEAGMRYRLKRIDAG